MAPEYKLICEYTWGGCPLDIEWAMATKIYQDMKEKLIKKGLLNPSNK